MAFTTQGLNYSITAPTLTGVWLHSTSDPAGTEGNYLFQSSGRNEGIEAEGEALRFIGRDFPAVEFGTQETHAIDLAVKVPHDDDHDDAVMALRILARSRTALCYRDNRKRLIFGVILGRLGVEDTVDGTNATFAVTRIDHAEG